MLPPIHLYALLAATATLLRTAAGNDRDSGVTSAIANFRWVPFVAAWIHIAWCIASDLFKLARCGAASQFAFLSIHALIGLLFVSMALWIHFERCKRPVQQSGPSPHFTPGEITNLVAAALRAAANKPPSVP